MQGSKATVKTSSFILAANQVTKAVDKANPYVTLRIDAETATMSPYAEIGGTRRIRFKTSDITLNGGGPVSLTIPVESLATIIDVIRMEEEVILTCNGSVAVALDEISDPILSITPIKPESIVIPEPELKILPESNPTKPKKPTKAAAPKPAKAAAPKAPSVPVKPSPAPVVSQDPPKPKAAPTVAAAPKAKPSNEIKPCVRCGTTEGALGPNGKILRRLGCCRSCYQKYARPGAPGDREPKAPREPKPAREPKAHRQPVQSKPAHQHHNGFLQFEDRLINVNNVAYLQTAENGGVLVIFENGSTVNLTGELATALWTSIKDGATSLTPTV
jgi:hypothetical protein